MESTVSPQDVDNDIENNGCWPKKSPMNVTEERNQWRKAHRAHSFVWLTAPQAMSDSFTQL